MKRSASLAMTLLLVASAGCDTKKKPAPLATKHAADAGPRVVRHRPKTDAELPTTDAEIYLGNLDGKIGELERLLKGTPENASLVQQLGGAHYTRGRYRGDLDEIQRGIDGATTCLRLEPTSGNCSLMRAEEEQSLHRFKEARADLAHARELGIEPTRGRDLETELDWNDGLYDGAIAAIRRARLDHPSTATWMREAQLDHDLGLYDDIDAKFEAAEDLVSDTAPLAIAHLNLQRGIERASRGREEDAVMFFREASRRMPGFVAANEHLAESLHALGKDDEAVTIYENVVKASNDPEFAHALGALYATRGKREEAKALEQKAVAGYEALLQKYPEAMYWHASEFFMATGNLKRALDLLRKNVVLRPNSASYVALARAELANGHGAEAKAAIDKALAMPVRSASLFWTASLVAKSAGDAPGAVTFRESAKKLNPRIELE